MSFQKRLLNLRKFNNITIKEMGEKLGVSSSTYFQWEIESYPHKPIYYKKIADIFNIDLLWLMFDKDN